MSEDSASASGDSMELPPEVMHDSSNDPYSNGPLSFQNGFSRGKQPYVEIVEQPQQRGFRFRYRCEGPSHGGLQGEHSERGNKTYPAIRIANYSGRARVLVMLVTDEKNPRTHAHELMGKNCKSGICTVDVQEGTTPDTNITFANLGILHVTKKKVEPILVERLSELERVNHEFLTGRCLELSAERKREIARQAKDDGKKMQLNVVRLKFVVYLPQGSTFTRKLEPVYTNPIYDSKCPGVAGLNICRMDRNAGCCTGHEEVFLLCDKVQKDDILVRFFEVDEDNHVKWEAFGNFGPSDVHRQYAIVFKTPPYVRIDITHPIQVSVQLRRISDCETSEPKPFTYYPQQQDKNEVGKKRKKTLHFPGSNNIFRSIPDSHRGFGLSNGSGNQAGSNNMGGGGNTNNGNVNNLSFFSSMGLSAAGPLIGHGSSDPQGNAASASGVIGSMHQTNQHLNFPQLNLNMPLMDTQIPQPGQTHLPNQIQSGQMMCKTSPVTSLTEGPLSIATSMGGDLTENIVDELETFLTQSSVGMPRTQTSPLNIIQNTICTSQTQIMPPTSLNQSIFVQKQEPLQQQSIAPQQFMQTGLNYGHLQCGEAPQQPQAHPRQPGYSTTQHPYSSNQAQYSPASQPTFSPGAQQGYSPNQQSYSPGAQHQFSPEAAHQYSPPHISPQSHSHIFSANDLVLDGGGTLDDAVCRPSDLDIECDSGEYVDADIEEDAVPIGADKAQEISKAFHGRQEVQRTAEADKQLLQDLEKLTLKEKDKKDEEAYVSTKKVKTAGDSNAGRATENSEEDEEQLLESVSKSGLVLALNVARRTVVALHNYARTGDPIYMILCQRHLVSVQDDLGDTALHMSIIHGRKDVSLRLLEAVSTLRHCAADIVNITNILNQTPLQLAVITHQASLISPLLQLGASSHLVDRRGDSPLHMAAKMGYNDCLKYLLQVLPGGRRQDADPSSSKVTEKLNFDGFSPLHLAVMHQHSDCVQTLLAAGVDVNHFDGRSGRAALHHATESNNINIARLILLQPDIDVDAHAYDGSTALHIGVGRKFIEIVRLLVYHNADPYKESYELVSEEDEDEEDLCIDSEEDKVFVRPIDLADSNQEMLDILLKKVVECQTSTSIIQQRKKSTGDIDELDQRTWSTLSEKLDPLLAGGDWQDLAKGLNLTNAMDGFRQQPSPTLHILDTFKVSRGTLQELRRVLNDMKRYDAAALVDDVISRVSTDDLPKLRPEITQLSKKPMSSDPKSFDSGLGSLSISLNSCS